MSQHILRYAGLNRTCCSKFAEQYACESSKTNVIKMLACILTCGAGGLAQRLFPCLSPMRPGFDSQSGQSRM